MKFKRTLAILLSALLLMCGLSMTALAADTEAGIAVEADKDHAVTGDVITYTVTLIDSDKVDGGIRNYEFGLTIGEGLEFVTGSGKIADTNIYDSAIFREESMWSSAMGLTGANGFTGASMVLMTFQCKVTEAAAGNATVSVVDVMLTDKNNACLSPADSSVSVHANTLAAQAGKDATCTEAGVKAHDKCSLCGKLFIDGVEVTDVTVAAKGHGEIEIKDAKDATCTEAGYTGDTYCKDCGEKTATGQEIPAEGHINHELRDAKEASCTEAGYTGDIYCKDCGEKLVTGEETPAKGHGETELKDAKDATCTEAGYTGDTYCKDCGEKISSGEETPANGHNYGDDNICDDCGHELPGSPDTGDASIVLWGCMVVMAFVAAAFAQKRKNA